MKKIMKKMLPIIVLSLVTSFMLFINEPILMLAGNVNDFWFDIFYLLKFTSIAFLIFGFISIAIYGLIYLIGDKYYKAFYLLYFILFIVTYIQGNYLVGGLPILDGAPIIWNNYLNDKIISACLLVVISVICIILYKKFGADSFIKYSTFVCLGVFFMLFTSLVTTLLSTKGLTDRNVTMLATFKDNDKYSTDKNFIILLVDAVDSRIFEKELNDNKEFKNLFNDFTYFPDTTSMHPFTIASLPSIVCGERYTNQDELKKWSTECMKNSPLLNELYDKNYEVGVFTRDITFNDKDALKIDNFVEADDTDNVNYMNYIKEETKYVLFKYLPFYLKQYSHIETMDFKLAAKNPENVFYYESNGIFDDVSTSNKINLIEKKNFRFFHIDGAHIPFSFDKSLEYKPDATYYDEVDGTITMINNYFNYLKTNNVYDNSAIIVMSDHGFNTNHSATGRFNPVFFVKGLGEKHDEMIKSDKPVSYVDLNSIYSDLLNDKKSTDILSNIEKDRKRVLLQYVAEHTEEMVELETTGKAWEVDKYKETGNVFKLN